MLLEIEGRVMLSVGIMNCLVKMNSFLFLILFFNIAFGGGSSI